MKLTYPVILEPFGDRPGFVAIVPDLPGCVTEGDTMADVILMAEDAASGWVLDELESGNRAPEASAPASIVLEQEQLLSILVLDMDAYAEKYGSKAVRKNLTIPAWLNTFAENQRINFSQLLTDALTSLYQAQA